MEYRYKLWIGVIGLSLVSGVALANIPDSRTVSQKNRTYTPEVMTIKSGERVKVLNDDMFLHHVFIESETLEFDSGSMEEGDAVEILFKEKGVYEVMCAIHPKMKLEVTVE